MSLRNSPQDRSSGTLFALVLFLVSGVAAFIFAPDNATAKITWTPGVIDRTFAPGSVFATTVSFTSTQSITNVLLSVTPSLRDVLTISPSQFATVTGGVAYSVRLTVTIPTNTKQPEYNGELMVRDQNATRPDSLKLRFRVGASVSSTPTSTARATTTATSSRSATPTATRTATATRSTTSSVTPTLVRTRTATPTNTSTATLLPNSFQLIEAALARGEINLDQATLYKVYALFASPRLPAQYQSATLIPDEGTAALLYALKDWNQLSPATQQTIADFITPKQVTISSPSSLQPARAPSATLTQRNTTPIRSATPTHSARLQVATAVTGTVTPPTLPITVTLTWERSRESETFDAGAIGVGITAGLQLATYPQDVWDNGTYTPPDRTALVQPGTQWASWQRVYSVDIRHFKGAFTFPAGLDPAMVQGVLYDPYYSTDLVPINDNLYVHLNGVFQFRGGSSYAGSVWGAIPYETDGWHIPTGITVTGFISGTNVVDIVTEERLFWGGLGYLALRLEPRPSPTPTATPTSTATTTATPTRMSTPTPTPTLTPNVGGLPWIQVAGCNLDQQFRTPQGNFLIWYTRTGRCAIIADPANDYPQTLGTRFEDARNRYSQMQYQLPSTRQPYQVFVVPITVPAFGNLASAITFSPEYAFMTNDARSDAAIPAHEFFHAVQWTYQQTCPRFDLLQVTSAWYDNEDLRWWMEATAEWAQQEAMPNDLTYIGPIRTYLNKPWQHIDTRPIQGRSDFAYSPLFPFYLIERVGARTPEIIRTIWVQYQQNGNCGAMKPVIQGVLRAQTPSTSIEQIFPEYTEENYFLAYANEAIWRNNPNPNVSLGNDFRPARDRQILNDQVRFATGPSAGYGGRNAEYLGAVYAEFVPGFTQPNLGRTLSINIDISVNNPSTPPVVRLWTITQSAPPRRSASIIPPVQLVRQVGSTRQYIAQATVSNFDSNQLQWVALMLTNPQIGGSSLNWSYRAEVIAPTPTPTATLTPMSTPTVTPTR